MVYPNNYLDDLDLDHFPFFLSLNPLPIIIN